MLTGAIKEREQKLQGQLEELGTRVAELSEQLQEVKVESRLDGLTRVANRADFDRAVKRWHHVGSAFGRPTCLILVDVDHLKRINDQYGHRGGDAALQGLRGRAGPLLPAPQRLRGAVRRRRVRGAAGRDAGPPGLRLAERFRQYIHGSPAEHDGQTITLTASIGLAQLEPGESIESWLERADQALYSAKQAGRTRSHSPVRPTRGERRSTEAGGREAAG